MPKSSRQFRQLTEKQDKATQQLKSGLEDLSAKISVLVDVMIQQKEQQSGLSANLEKIYKQNRRAEGKDLKEEYRRNLEKLSELRKARTRKRLEREFPEPKIAEGSKELLSGGLLSEGGAGKFLGGLAGFALAGLFGEASREKRRLQEEERISFEEEKYLKEANQKIISLLEKINVNLTLQADRQEDQKYELRDSLDEIKSGTQKVEVTNAKDLVGKTGPTPIIEGRPPGLLSNLVDTVTSSVLGKTTTSLFNKLKDLVGLGTKKAGEEAVESAAKTAGEEAVESAAKTAGKGALEDAAESAAKVSLKNMAKWIPIVGGAVDFAINKSQGDTTGRALTRAIGSQIGLLGGAAAGGVATGGLGGEFVGGAAGAMGGDIAAAKLYDQYAKDLSDAYDKAAKIFSITPTAVPTPPAKLGEAKVPSETTPTKVTSPGILETASSFISKLTSGAQKNIQLLLEELKKKGFGVGQIAAVLGNVGKESGFKSVSENLNYAGTSVERIRKIFGERTAGKSDVELEKIKKDPYQMAEMMYGSTTKVGKNLGNVEPGDGFKYRGRGFVQLTGKNNYAAASKAIYGDDRLVKNPDLASESTVAAQIAAWYAETQGKSFAKKMGIDITTAGQETLNRLYTSAIAGRIIKPGETGYIGGELLSKVTAIASQFLPKEPPPMVTNSPLMIPRPQTFGQQLYGISNAMSGTPSINVIAPTNNNVTTTNIAGGGSSGKGGTPNPTPAGANSAAAATKTARGK